MIRKLLQSTVERQLLTSSSSSYLRLYSVGNGSGGDGKKEDTALQAVMRRLRCLDTASLCDAEKDLLAEPDEVSSSTRYSGLRLVKGLNSLNSCHGTMVGLARTVQCTRRNDFLAVLRGLEEAKLGDVLVVNTFDSTRAVAGGLFGTEAERKGLCGIVVEGPMRDVASLQSLTSVRCFASSITPYAGTVQSVGETQVNTTCGGVQVCPGDIVVGDDDGIVVGCVNTFAQLLDAAESIQGIEENIMVGMSKGFTLHSMTTYEQHLKLRMAGKESSLEFQLK